MTGNGLALSAAVLMVALAGGSMASEILLVADFDGLTPGLPLETGGPFLGEPIGMSPDGVSATIDGSVMGSNSVRLEDTGDWGTAWVRFEFLPPYEIDSGTITLSMDLLFPAIESYFVKIREKYTSASSFGEVWFDETGRIGMIDARGFAGYLGSYRTGVVEHLELVYDMDTGTYDVILNGDVVLDNRAHHVTTGRGVGSILIAPQSDPDLDGVFFVDNILVFTSAVVANEQSTWGSIKALFLD
jgi:hypothetical protein